MSRSTPQTRKLARRVVGNETRTNSSIVAETSVTFHAVERLRPQLETLMGSRGVRALLLRSLTLAKEEAPWLRTARVNADGSLEGLETIHAQLRPTEALEGQVVLLAQLLALLMTLIGESLTLNLVHEAWPSISIADLERGNGVKNAKSR